jgi:hypothetical protein
VTTTICSGFSPSGLAEYGATFMRTFDQFWPQDTDLAVYTEQPCTGPDRVMIRSLWDCPGEREFLTRHRHNKAAHGREPTPSWKEGDRRRGYSFRFDAVKFSRQCVIPLAASKHLPDGDILAWSDADVVAFKPLPRRFISGLLGDADGVYMGRQRKHSEIGFWAVRLAPDTRVFLEMLADTYVTDGVFGLGEWHSAFVWDTCRRNVEAHGVTFRNLTPRGHDHVWHQCDLGLYTDHLKGGRKALGRSPERRTR